MNINTNDDDMTERSTVSSGLGSSFMSNLFHSSFWSSSLLEETPDADDDDSSELESDEFVSDNPHDNVSLEGTLLHKTTKNGPWKRRYVVLHFQQGGSLECFKFSKKEFPTKLAKRKMYTQLHHNHRETTMASSSTASAAPNVSTIAKQQDQIWNLSSDMPWHVMDIPHSSNFLVEMENADEVNISNSPVVIMEEETVSSSSIGSSCCYYYFQCPHGSNEKTLWLGAFDKLNRLAAADNKKTKQQRQQQFHKLSNMSKTLATQAPRVMVGRLRRTSTAFKLRYESLKLADQDEFHHHYNNNNNTTSMTAAAAAVSQAILAAEKEAELLSRKDKNLDSTYKVLPSYAYPNMRLNRDQLRNEMLLPSSNFHDLRVPSRKMGDEIGLLRVEVLQCLGLPKLDSIGETDPVVYMVCGASAFCTDVIPECGNPMWLRKMRRACIFPLHHAYARLYVGVFDDDGKNEKDDYCGRVVLDISRLRPKCTYDVTLPLRLSAHVYSRRQRGAIRLRFHLEWTKGERAAMLSYLPKRKALRLPTSHNKREKDVMVLCNDEKAFQNVAMTVHGAHMPGRFSAKQLKATLREINFTRIMVIRFVIMKQIKDTMAWRNPTISLYAFLAWMQCVYADSFALVPGHLVTFLLLHLWRNYAIYGIDVPAQRGFLPLTWEEMMLALLKGDPHSDSKCIAPLDMKTGRSSATDETVPAFAPYMSSRLSNTKSLEEIAEAFKKGVKVRDRRFHLKRYTHVFMGKEAVSFLVDSNFARSRKDAVRIGRALSREYHLFEHVTNAHEFKDERLFYRFVCYDETDYILETHKPRGKSVFRALGFLEDHDELYNDADEHLEFPYANGKDYPKFTVRESLVNRLSRSPKAGERRQSIRFEEEENEFGASEFHLSDVDSSPMNESNTSILSEGSEETDGLHDPNLDVSNHMDDTDIFQGFKSDDEMDDAAEGSSSKQDYVMVEVRPKRPPPPQNMDFQPKKDKDITEVLQNVKEKMHELTFQLFNDRVYVLKNSGKASSGEKSSRSKKKQLDKLLSTGQYSHPNPGVSKIGLYLEPIIGMILPFLCVFRALFNIFTWRDPIISFWISLFAPVLIIILHIFPWRWAMLALGVLAVGPQNWILRKCRERKESQAPNDDAVTSPKYVKRPIERDSKEQPVFYSHLRTYRGETKQSTRARDDDSSVYRVAVPYNALMYQRFYDWPPEPQYARVVADADSSRSPVDKSALSQSSLPASASTDTMECMNERVAGKKRGFTRIRRRFRGRGSSKD